MTPPLWYSQLTWSVPRIAVNTRRADIPEQPGCYAFTADPGPLVPQRVLYVGKADNLRNRLPGYLVDFMRTAPTKHKGRAFLFEYRQKNGDPSLYLRWTVYGDPRILEASLIDFLEPQMRMTAGNTRFWPMTSDWTRSSCPERGMRAAGRGRKTTPPICLRAPP
jgi:hypothetical protein